MGDTMKGNNQGLSLVELLVAMAIMAVLGSMIFIGLGIIPRTNAKSCANGLKTIIGQTRIQTMGKRETVLELFRNETNGNYYTAVYIDNGSGTLAPSQEELCGKSMVKISYHEVGASGYKDLAEEPSGQQKWIISFDRGTGRVIKCGLASRNTSEDPSENTLCDGILIEGGGASYLISIYPATGKIVMETN